MNAFERQKERIMKKLNNKELQHAKAFQSQNSEIQESLEIGQLHAGQDDSTDYLQDQKIQTCREDTYSKTDSLRQSLIMIHQTNILDTVFSFIDSKNYWLKFSAFKTIFIHSSTNSQPINKQHIHKNLIQNIWKDRSEQEFKRLAFLNFKQAKNQTQRITILKTQFFIKYFIDAEYAKLSFSFSAIKSFAESQSLLKKVGREKSQMRMIENKEKLIKFGKQSRKFRAKSVFVAIRNFLNKKCFKISFSAVKYWGFQRSLQVRGQNWIGNGGQKCQSKDARFIKKKIVPHRIIQEHSSKRSLHENNFINLNNIYLGNQEVKSVKKSHIEFIRRLDKFVNSKIMGYFLQFYRNFTMMTGQKQTAHNQNPILQHTDDSDFDMIQSVMKSICYLSSKIHSNRKNPKEKQNKIIALFYLNKFTHKSQLNHKASAFYMLKFISLNHYLSIATRIKELEQVKKYCLEYFDNSVLEIEDQNYSH